MIIGIYIPIWLDLLCESYGAKVRNKYNLHSNMVRFIINQGKNDGVGDM